MLQNFKYNFRKMVGAEEKMVDGFEKTSDAEEKSIDGFEKMMEGKEKTIERFEKTSQGKEETVDGFKHYKGGKVAVNLRYPARSALKKKREDWCSSAILPLLYFTTRICLSSP